MQSGYLPQYSNIHCAFLSNNSDGSFLPQTYFLNCNIPPLSKNVHASPISILSPLLTLLNLSKINGQHGPLITGPLLALFPLLGMHSPSSSPKKVLYLLDTHHSSEKVYFILPFKPLFPKVSFCYISIIEIYCNFFDNLYIYSLKYYI